MQLPSDNRSGLIIFLKHFTRLEHTESSVLDHCPLTNLFQPESWVKSPLFFNSTVNLRSFLLYLSLGGGFDFFGCLTMSVFLISYFFGNSSDKTSNNISIFCKGPPDLFLYVSIFQRVIEALHQELQDLWNYIMPTRSRSLYCI